MKKNRRETIFLLAALLSAFILGFVAGHGDDFRDFDYEMTFEGERVDARVRFNLPYALHAETVEAAECLLYDFFSRLDGIMNIPSEHGLESPQKQPQKQSESPPITEQQRGVVSPPLV